MSTMPADYIVVTRPADSGEALCSAIIDQGGQALHFPTIAFDGPSNEAGFLTSVQKMGEQDWLIFNSPQSVKACVPKLRSTWPNFPDTVRFAAVGAGTAAALKDAGYLASAFPEDDESSEGLLALSELQSVSDKKVMIIKGAGGREFLQKKLEERGGLVTSCIAYRRMLPKTDPGQCRQLIKNNQVFALVAGSFESVNNLKLLLGESIWQFTLTIPLLVMSERIKLLAQALGFADVWVVNVASHQAVLNFIAHKKEVLCQKHNNQS